MSNEKQREPLGTCEYHFHSQRGDKLSHQKGDFCINWKPNAYFWKSELADPERPVLPTYHKGDEHYAAHIPIWRCDICYERAVLPVLPDITKPRDELMKALKCLYIAAPEHIAKDVIDRFEAYENSVISARASSPAVAGRTQGAWEDWRGQLLDAWRHDYRATMNALLEGGPALRESAREAPSDDLIEALKTIADAPTHITYEGIFVSTNVKDIARKALCAERDEASPEGPAASEKPTTL
jgi:hypothetical protein